MNALSLGKKPSAKPTKKLETFANPCTSRDFHIQMQIPEFTCLCPKTGQPDFATLYLDYIPNKKCVELKVLSFISGLLGMKAVSMRPSLIEF